MSIEKNRGASHMSIDNTKRILEDCLTYNFKIESLRKELKNTTSDKLQNKINTEIDDLTEKAMNIRTKIESLNGSNVRLVMRMRYINLMHFNEIADKLGVSYQWINKLHNNGIEQLSKIL